MEKKYHTVVQIPKSNIKIIERGKIDTPNTQIHDNLTFLAWYRHFNEESIIYKLFSEPSAN